MPSARRSRDRQAAGALGEALAADVREQRQVAEPRRRGAEGLEDLRLRAGVGDVVGAADDVGDAELDVVDDRRQRVEIAAVRAHEDGIALAGLVDMLGAAHEIVPAHVLVLAAGSANAVARPRPPGARGRRP